jgi:hypothetical protein
MAKWSALEFLNACAFGKCETLTTDVVNLL